MTATTAGGQERITSHAQSEVNLSDRERQISLASGALLLGIGLCRVPRGRGLLLLALGGAAVYRGLSGHCHVYEALGWDTQDSPGDHTKAESSPSSETRHAPERPAEIQTMGPVDQDRFDKLVATQVERGRDEQQAQEIALEEVQELRRREGRTREAAIDNAERIEEAEIRKGN